MVRPSAHPRWKSHREGQGRDEPHYPPAAREAPIAADKQPGHSLQQTGERRSEASRNDNNLLIMFYFVFVNSILG